MSEFPRVYRASGGWLIFLTIAGAALAAGGGIATGYLLTHRSVGSAWWIVCLCAGVAALGIYVLLSTYRSKVILYPDRLEVEELTRTDVLSREEIRGWRSAPTSPPAFVFVPKDPARRTVKVAQVFRLDAVFAEWVGSLPCLDTDDHKRSKAEIRNDARLGSTPGERMRALASGRRIARIANIAAGLVSLWVFLRPEPYELAIAAAALLPWIAVGLVRWSRGLFRVDSPRHDVHPDLALLAIVSPMILVLRAVLDYELLHTAALGWIAVGIGVLLWWSLYSADETVRKRRGSVIAILAFSLIYGYGAAVQANALFDRSRESSYSAVVISKRVVSGKSTSYQVEVGAWGPIDKPDRIRVGKATYDHIQPGDTVHFTLRDGAFGAKWYYMRSWERTRQSAN